MKKTSYISEAFTLVELLVVIAIISVLMTMLLPALRNSRELAKSSYCLNNMRQLGVISNLYINDYDDFLPRGYLCVTSLSDHVFWYDRFKQYDNSFLHAKGKTSVYSCPSLAIWWHNSPAYGDYGNYTLYEGEVPNLPYLRTFVKVSKIRRPAQRLWLADPMIRNNSEVWRYYSLSMFNTPFTGVPYYRHNHKASTLFIAGNVKLVKFNQFMDEYSKWAYP